MHNCLTSRLFEGYVICMKNKFRYKINSLSSLFAFTLAEVLITLGIIGVVASMTIPTLMNNINDNQYKSAYKKAFSAAAQAWAQAVNDGLIEERPTWGDLPSKIANFNTFKTYFKIMKDCNNSNNSECWAVGDTYGGCPTASAYAFLDASGVSWSLTSMAVGNGPEILVDVNGFKDPNKFGQDRFVIRPVTISGLAGMPVKMLPPADYLTADVSYCKYGDSHPCYYSSWLYD